jgi:hypothetical protein
VSIVALLALAGCIIGVAWWQVGPAPTAVDDGISARPPLLLLPTGTEPDSALGTAAAQLAAGRHDDARRSLIALVGDDPDDVVAQTGLVLTRWRTTGPDSVERGLRQLTAEYPEAAFVQLHLGLTQLALRDVRSARESLELARTQGWLAADPTSLRVARLADDLMHPEAFRGALPVLVRPGEIADPAAKAQLRELLAAVEADDRRRAERSATALERAEPMARVAAAAAAFDKGDIGATTDAMLELATNEQLPAPVRGRAALHAALTELWTGGDRRSGCRQLRALAGSDVDPATQRLAQPLVRELCAEVR